MALAIGTLRDLLEARLDGMDKATELHQKGVERIPDLIQKEMRQLNDVNTEKFNAMPSLSSSVNAILGHYRRTATGM